MQYLINMIALTVGDNKDMCYICIDSKYQRSEKGFK